MRWSRFNWDLIGPLNLPCIFYLFGKSLAILQKKKMPHFSNVSSVKEENFPAQWSSCPPDLLRVITHSLRSRSPASRAPFSQRTRSRIGLSWKQLPPRGAEQGPGVLESLSSSEWNGLLPRPRGREGQRAGLKEPLALGEQQGESHWGGLEPG